MKQPQMPVARLVAALHAAAVRAGTEPALGEALGGVATRLGLDGLRLVIANAEPTRAIEAGWGTIASNPGRAPDFDLTDEDGTLLARVWADGGEAAVEAAAAVIEAVVMAVLAQLAAERTAEHLAALDAALRGVSGAIDADAVLQLIVDRVRDLADAEYAALGIVGDDGTIRQFLTSGISAGERRAIGALPQGRGLLGLLIRERHSIRIPDITLDPRRSGFPANHPPMRSFLGVPITVRGSSVGNLYLTDKHGEAEFTAADQDLVERFAMHAGIAIEQARLANQVQQLLLIEERERIGADLHDGVIQRIYGVNLSLDEVPELVASDPDEAARRVEGAIQALNATIGEIREFIYILRPPGSEGGGLDPSLRALAAEVRLQTGLPVEVIADELPAIAAGPTREVIAIVREALSNAARHASADHAHIAVRAEGGSVVVEVADDGIGFNADAEHGDGHHGLVNMRRRAERLGGTLQVKSRPDAGSRIIVAFPTEREPKAGGGHGRA